jgi:16S rRNA (guanine527-N7)-methyltransferase
MTVDIFSEIKDEKFQNYLDLLEQFNASMNLVGPMSQATMMRELILDSLAPLTVWPNPNATVIDVGSGAGLPGIPLAISLPNAQFTLVEPRKKRAQFLRIAAHRLGLKNIQVTESRIEDAQLPPFDIAISKAVFSPEEFLEIMINHVSQNGFLISMCAENATDSVKKTAADLHLRLLSEIQDVSTITGHKTEVLRAIMVWQKGD